MNLPWPADHPLWVEGLDLLGRGAWFEAHERLEDLWRPLPPSPAREALQGLIQAAVALEHLRRGNQVGATRVWERARARWARLDEWPLSPELARWAGDLLTYMALDTPSQGSATPPRPKFLDAPSQGSATPSRLPESD